MEDTGGPQASHIGSADEGTGVLYSPPLELQSFAVKDAPQGTFYIRNFVDSGTEEMLMQVWKSKFITFCTLTRAVVLFSVLTSFFLF